jgi:hypothetical protein
MNCVFQFSLRPLPLTFLILKIIKHYTVTNVHMSSCKVPVTLQWNFLWQTAVSRCEVFSTFRELTLPSSSGCAGGFCRIKTDDSSVLILPKPPAQPKDGDAVPDTSEKHYILTWLCVRENYVEFCRRESFKTYYPLSLWDSEFSLNIFWKIFKFKISWKSLQWKPSRSVRTDRHTWRS